MRATIHIPANVAGMGFRIPWRGHHPNPTSITSVVRAIQHSPNVCSRPRFHNRPLVGFRIPNRFPDMFVWMIGQVRALASCLVTLWISRTNSSAWAPVIASLRRRGRMTGHLNCTAHRGGSATWCVPCRAGQNSLEFCSLAAKIQKDHLPSLIAAGRRAFRKAGEHLGIAEHGSRPRQDEQQEGHGGAGVIVARQMRDDRPAPE